MNLKELTTYLDEYLRIGEIADESNNGLQVEGAVEVRRIAFAVDACLAAFEGARDADTQLLVVHHGLFWGSVKLVTGLHHRQLRTLLGANVSLYGVHLPLDAHPEVGNNAELFRLLGLQERVPFGMHDDFTIGFGGEVPRPLTRDAFVLHASEVLGMESQLLPFGPDRVQRVAICSGSASSLIEESGRSGYDTFITGETDHAYYHTARECGLNILYLGHYVSETVGLQALARHLDDRFSLETTFLDIPTGM